jgi:hypothetical protein
MNPDLGKRSSATSLTKEGRAPFLSKILGSFSDLKPRLIASSTL